MLNVESRNRIGDQWIEGDQTPFQSTSPSDGSPVWSGRAAGPDQVSAAFGAARRAFGQWWDAPPARRLEICRNFAGLVGASADGLATLISREMGKTLWESRAEVATVVGKIEISIEAMENRRSTTSFELGGMQAVTRYKPHGVLAVLGPFNFPAHLPNGHIVPALLAGNTVVFKPSEMTPAVGAWMVQAWEMAGLPPGVLNLVQGGRSTGEAVAANPACDGLLFTGSAGAGRALHRLYADKPQKILALEMGGNNPLVVFRADNPEAAAYLIFLSAFISSGQRCTCARRLIVVDDGRTGVLLEKLLQWVARARWGYWSDDPEPFGGTVINAAAGERVLRAWEESLQAGGTAILEPKRLRGNPALVSPGIADVTGIRNRGDDEVFGPLLNLVRVPDFESAIEEANRTAYGLSAGLISGDAECYREFSHRIRAGIVNWNRQTTGASSKLPFGGCGLSGNHRPAGFFSADYCSWPAASLESPGLELPTRLETGIDA